MRSLRLLLLLPFLLLLLHVRAAPGCSAASGSREKCLAISVIACAWCPASGVCGAWSACRNVSAAGAPCRGSGWEPAPAGPPCYNQAETAFGWFALTVLVCAVVTLVLGACMLMCALAFECCTRIGEWADRVGPRRSAYIELDS